MANDNLSGSPEPVATTAAPTEDELVEQISDLLDDPATDPVKEPEDAEAAPVEEDDPLGLAEDVEEEKPEDPDGSDAEIKGGRFAPDSAKVKLEDGTTITIAELKRNNLYHAGFTQKTQALSEERKSFDAERQKVTEYAQSLDQSREYLAWYAETHLPKQPAPFEGDPELDPMGFMRWQRDMGKWQEHAQAFQTFQQQKQADDQRKTGETAKQTEERQKREAAKVLDAIPALKDPVKGKAVWEAIVSGAQQHYGASADEVYRRSLENHMDLVILRDALAYRRIKARAPQVQAEVGKRPPLKEARRAPANQQQVKAREQRLERLKRDPSLANGAASLMDFDL
jgi:hypothetical protein